MLKALGIVLLGMAVIFAVLGVLFVVMIVVNKLVQPGKKGGVNK